MPVVRRKDQLRRRLFEAILIACAVALARRIFFVFIVVSVEWQLL